MGRDQEEATDREAQSAVGEYAPDFVEPSCSWESVEDASSSPPVSLACLLSRFNSASRLDPPASPLNNGGGQPYELSDLMAHLPIKRGLSRFYEGKSQSFTSLASARSIEDLAKEENPKRKRSRLCKSSEEDSVGGQWSPMYSHPMSEISKDSPSVLLSPFFTFSKPKISQSNFRDISYGQYDKLD